MVKAAFALILAGFGALLAFFLGARFSASEITEEVEAARAASKAKNAEAWDAIDRSVEVIREDVEKVHNRDELARMLDE
jgi:hypothetical protein